MLPTCTIINYLIFVLKTMCIIIIIGSNYHVIGAYIEFKSKTLYTYIKCSIKILVNNYLLFITT